MWDLPGSVLEPVSPALVGRFLTTVPPGKPLALVCDVWLCREQPWSLCLAVHVDSGCGSVDLASL